MNGTVSKTVVSLRVPRVRIPDSPPFFIMESPILFCNASLPISGGGTLREEFILYHLDSALQAALINEFASITGKELNPQSDLHTLSGGQKVLMMTLLALLSPAKSIHFVNLWHSLDTQNRDLVKELIARLGAGRRITHSAGEDDN